MIILLLYGLYISIIYTTVFNDVKYNAFVHALWIIAILALHSTSILALLLSVTRNRNHLRNVLTIISFVDSKLLHKHCKQSVYMHQRSHIVWQLIVEFILYGIPSAFSWILFYDGTWTCLVYLVSDTIATVTNAVVILQYVSIVLIVKRRYQYIRHLLSEAAFTDDFCTSTHMYAGHPVSHDSDKLFLSERYKVKNGRGSRNMYRIHDLQIIYSELYDVLHANSKTYGILILLNIMAILTITVPTTYLGVVFLTGAVFNTDKTDVYFRGICFFCQSSSGLLTFLWLTICCHSTADEVKDTIVCIQKLLLRPNRLFWSTEDLKRLLSQLKNLKVEFSVCGLFSLNLQLLSGSVGVIITYILVLNQFNY
ncbi:hypothetical protein B7P43_G13507 [Cryptotermes secundus]|uniref:Gustatory receptor n=1 Tax=Cryptotermes secundus TaxID=105785 RepID=A0A2J7PYM9_9NEOP|nr:hypothetical protein B7P43_G13507 [Cryptotermes secundus]